MAIFVDQHIRRLDIAVHDQVGVCVRHRAEHIKKERDPSLNIERALVAITIDWVALDIFKDDIRLPGGTDACVE